MPTTTLILIGAYLLGSVSSGVLVSRVLGLADPRGKGSHNPGATNVLRLSGSRAALFTLIGDMAKGTIAVLAAQALSNDPVVWAGAGVAVFLGHLYPLFFGFRGGKGVATAIGVMLGMSYLFAPYLIAVWVVMAVIFRYSSLASLTMALAMPLIAYFLGGDIALIGMCTLIAVFLIWRHRTNITRLMKGAESKVDFAKFRRF